MQRPKRFTKNHIEYVSCKGYHWHQKRKQLGTGISFLDHQKSIHKQRLSSNQTVLRGINHKKFLSYDLCCHAHGFHQTEAAHDDAHQEPQALYFSGVTNVILKVGLPRQWLSTLYVDNM